MVSASYGRYPPLARGPIQDFGWVVVGDDFVRPTAAAASTTTTLPLGISTTPTPATTTTTNHRRVMFYICVFRRYGIAVPILLFLFGFLLQYWVDNQWGVGYYQSHSWPLGLTLLLTGGVVTALSCFLAEGDYSAVAQSSSSLLGGDKNNAVEDCLEQGRHTAETFVREPSESDSFCYIPLNHCALGLMATGVVLMLVQLALPAAAA